MNIWIDLTDLKSWEGNFTGIQRVVYNLAAQYASSAPEVRFFRYSQRRSRFYEYPFASLSQKRNFSGKISHPLWPSLFKKLRLIYQRRKPVRFERNAIILVLGAIWIKKNTLSALIQAKQASGSKLMVLIHDLIPIYAPHLVNQKFSNSFRHYLTQTLAAADALVTVSRASQHDIERFCRDSGITVPQISLIRLGDDLTTNTATTIPNLVPAGFILMLGMIELRKNPLLVYLMVKQALREGIKLPPIIMVGRPSWIPGQFDFIKDLIELDPEIGSHIQIMTDLNDAAINWLYQNCIFSIFPSFYEGWGLPVAESLRHGKLCLTSSASSIPEIAGDLLEYVSPYDSKGLLDLVQKYLDPEVRASKERELAAHYHPQDWDACFAQLNAIVQQLQTKD